MEHQPAVPGDGTRYQSMMKHLTIASLLAVAVLGCAEKPPRTAIQGGGAIPIIVSLSGQRYNGVCSMIDLGDRQIMSGVLIAQDGSPESTMTVNADNDTVVNVGGLQTVINGRPLVIVIRDGFTIVSRERIPNDLHDMHEIQRWCQETLDNVSSGLLLDLLANKAGNNAAHTEDGITRLRIENQSAVPGDG